MCEFWFSAFLLILELRIIQAHIWQASSIEKNEAFDDIILYIVFYLHLHNFKVTAINQQPLAGNSPETGLIHGVFWGKNILEPTL